MQATHVENYVNHLAHLLTGELMVALDLLWFCLARSLLDVAKRKAPCQGLIKGIAMS